MAGLGWYFWHGALGSTSCESWLMDAWLCHVSISPDIARAGGNGKFDKVCKAAGCGSSGL